MKRILQSFFLAFIILTIACEKVSHFNLGFNTQISGHSQGSLDASISDTDEKILLNGIIQLSEGELEIIFVNSRVAAVLSKTIIAPAEIQLRETFEPKRGGGN